MDQRVLPVGRTVQLEEHVAEATHAVGGAETTRLERMQRLKVMDRPR
jgi:hypothetical protein